MRPQLLKPLRNARNVMSMIGVIILVCTCVARGPAFIKAGWIEANIPLLEHELKTHQFVFIIGQQHSGTSLLKRLLDTHPRVSRMFNNDVMENEGHYIQTVYPSNLQAANIWGYNPNLRFFENSTLATTANRLKLYAEWRRCWNVSKEIMVEKSPQHMIMTRLLQWYFKPEQSTFVVVLRHPLGTLRTTMFNSETQKQLFRRDCGAAAIQHWLHIHDALFADIPFLKKVTVLHYERLVLGSSQAVFDELLQYLGLDAFITINITDSTPRQHRREFSGDWRNPTISRDSVYSWINTYQSTTTSIPELCDAMVARYEDHVARYGYSLRELRRVVPTAFTQRYLLGNN